MSDSETLAAFLDSTPAGTRLRVEDDLGDGFVRLRVSEAERRQAKQDIRCVEDAVIEMLRNARDAHARTIIMGTSRSGDARRIIVADDGDGVPERLRDRIFEPRVTSKLNSMTMDEWGVHGRGMALYSVREMPSALNALPPLRAKAVSSLLSSIVRKRLRKATKHAAVACEAERRNMDRRLRSA